MSSVLSRRSRLNAFGAIILLIGLSVSGFLFWRGFQNHPDGDGEDSFSTSYDSRAYEQAVERNIGPAGVAMNKLWENVAKLGEPRPLAILIVVVSSFVAGRCFLLASRQPPS